jgi:hypothetical protein
LLRERLDERLPPPFMVLLTPDGSRLAAHDAFVPAKSPTPFEGWLR